MEVTERIVFNNPRLNDLTPRRPITSSTSRYAMKSGSYAELIAKFPGEENSK